jgi:hypothetical protein
MSMPTASPPRSSAANPSDDALQNNLVMTDSAETIQSQSRVAAAFGYVGTKSVAFVSTLWGAGCWLAETFGGVYEDMYPDPDEDDEIVENDQDEATTPKTPTPPPLPPRPPAPPSDDDESAGAAPKKRRSKPAKRPAATVRKEADARDRYFALCAADKPNKTRRAQVAKDLHNASRPPDKSNQIPLPWFGNANAKPYWNREGMLPPPLAGNYTETYPGGTSAGEKVGHMRMISGGGHAVKWHTDGGTHPGPDAYWTIYADGRWWYWDIGIADATQRAREFDRYRITLHDDASRLTLDESRTIVDLNRRGSLFKGKKGGPLTLDPFKIERAFLKTAALQAALLEVPALDWLGDAEPVPPVF